MDVMEAPLNLAHSQSRKADKHLQAGKWDEAIQCHQVAIDYLQAAMSKTTVPRALESIKLQQQRHLAEISITKTKERYAKMQILLKEQEMRKMTELADEAQKMALFENADKHGFNIHRHVNSSPMNHDSQLQELDNEALVYRTIEESDSLLTFLRSRAMATGRGYKVVDAKCDTCKVPKTEKTVIEELRVHNDALRIHIHDLLQENEAYTDELEYLKRENADFRRMLTDKRESDLVQGTETLLESTESDKSEKYYPNPHRMDINDLPSLELPPLEMPKFDFDQDLLKDAAKDFSL